MGDEPELPTEILKRYCFLQSYRARPFYEVARPRKRRFWADVSDPVSSWIWLFSSIDRNRPFISQRRITPIYRDFRFSICSLPYVNEARIDSDDILFSREPRKRCLFYFYILILLVHQICLNSKLFI